jgi:hypothetical protein
MNIDYFFCSLSSDIFLLQATNSHRLSLRVLLPALGIPKGVRHPLGGGIYIQLIPPAPYDLAIPNGRGYPV